MKKSAQFPFIPHLDTWIGWALSFSFVIFDFFFLFCSIFVHNCNHFHLQGFLRKEVRALTSLSRRFQKELIKMLIGIKVKQVRHLLMAQGLVSMNNPNPNRLFRESVKSHERYVDLSHVQG